MIDSEDVAFRQKSAVRRRGVVAGAGSCAASSHTVNATRIRPRARRRKRRKYGKVTQFYYQFDDQSRRICHQRSSVILLCSFLFWMGVQVTKIIPMGLHNLRRQSGSENAVKQKHDVMGGLVRSMGQGKQSSATSVQDVPDGCERSDWHAFAFPDCNRIHELDLQEQLGQRGKPNISDTPLTSFLGSGYWRDVWMITPHPGGVSVALKVMKESHTVNSKSLDRHRRDALTMERLSSSPYIVPLYGYCGNTVLTEYIDRTLDKVLLDEEDESPPRRTREAPLERLHLSLDVARGIEAMHSIPGGPILHADLRATQVLVDPNGNVKINDFNRCRFMSHDAKTGEPCFVQLSSAPGWYHSPEEYELDPLTEKIDIYSLSHILYSILTGERPWAGYENSVVKELVKNGTKPVVDERFLLPEFSDAALSTLIDSLYELNPNDRMNATELVNALEDLVAAEEAKLK